MTAFWLLRLAWTGIGFVAGLVAAMFLQEWERESKVHRMYAQVARMAAERPELLVLFTGFITLAGCVPAWRMTADKNADYWEGWRNGYDEGTAKIAPGKVAPADYSAEARRRCESKPPGYWTGSECVDGSLKISPLTESECNRAPYHIWKDGECRRVR